MKGFKQLTCNGATTHAKINELMQIMSWAGSSIPRQRSRPREFMYYDKTQVVGHRLGTVLLVWDLFALRSVIGICLTFNYFCGLNIFITYALNHNITFNSPWMWYCLQPDLYSRAVEYKNGCSIIDLKFSVRTFWPRDVPLSLNLTETFYVIFWISQIGFNLVNPSNSLNILNFKWLPLRFLYPENKMVINL